MKQVRNEAIKVRRLTDGSGHYFFGYYDIPAWSGNERFHLCHRVKFWDRLQEKEDAAELGMVDIQTGQFVKLAETTAWNFQQGSMLQWNPAAPDDEVIFNIRDGEEYRGIIMNVHTGDRRLLELPAANVDPLGRYALSINFNRLFDFRPGYGYAGVKDRFFDRKHPEDDGIFLIDLNTGKAKMIISLQQIWDFTGSSLQGSDVKLLVNHITFNTNGTRFVFLVRYFPEPGKQWGTAILTANTDGSGMFVLSDYSYASHYHWRDPENVLFYSRGKEGGDAGDQLYLLKDRTHQVEILDRGFFLEDGHCSYSPDRKWLLYDSYPFRDGKRHLYLYNLQDKNGMELGAYYSQPEISGDIRCDLHPRWSPSGKRISFDSIHEGQRHLYAADLSEYLV